MTKTKRSPLTKRVKVSSIMSEAQKAEAELIFRRRVKVALTKSYKRLDAYLRIGPKDLLRPKDEAECLEYEIIGLAVKRAKLKVKT